MSLSMLNQTDLKDNHNKFYLIQLLTLSNREYIVWTRWGRVGAKHSAGKQGCDVYNNVHDAIAYFERKFSDKTHNSWSNRNNFKAVKGKYTLIHIDYDTKHEEETKVHKLPGTHHSSNNSYSR